MKLTRRLQYGHHLAVAPLPGLVQGGLSVLVPQVRIRAVTQQSLGTHTEAPFIPMAVEWRFFPHPPAGALVYLGDLRSSKTGGVMQRRRPLSSVDIGAALTQELHLTGRINARLFGRLDPQVYGRFTISCVPKADAQLRRVWPTSSMKFTSNAADRSGTWSGGMRQAFTEAAHRDHINGLTRHLQVVSTRRA